MNVTLFLGILGLICIVIGISFHLGYFRGPIVYWTTATSGIYATAPIGVGLLFLSLMTQFPYPNKIGIWLMTVAFVFLTIGIVLGLTMPQFLTPWWFRYLRENYGESFIFVLLKDAADNYSSWTKQTQTQEGLEAWVAEVRRKHGLEK
jgi:hypothetical protein